MQQVEIALKYRATLPVRNGSGQIQNWKTNQIPGGFDYPRTQLANERRAKSLSNSARNPGPGRAEFQAYLRRTSASLWSAQAQPHRKRRTTLS